MNVPRNGAHIAARSTRLVALLLGVEFLDEAYSGVPALGSADVQSSFGASYGMTAWVLLFVPGVVALVLEPILFTLSDRYPRKWFVCGGLGVMAVAALLASVAPTLTVLAIAMSLAWVGSGSGVALSQATLVDEYPDDRERALNRWALFGEIGDLFGPILVAGAALIGSNWRGAYAVVGLVVGVWAVWLSRQTFRNPGHHEDDDERDEEPGGFAAFRAALGNRRLLFWLGAAALCDLLDDLVVVFAVLYLHDHLGADVTTSSMVMGVSVVGAIVGALLADRLLRRVAPIRLLLVVSVACTGLYAGWLYADSLWLSALLFFGVGVTAAPMYPIASAQAYAALPGKSGTVNAAAHAFTPLLLALPWALGLAADHLSLRTTLAFLLLQPVGLALVSVYALATNGPERPIARR